MSIGIVQLVARDRDTSFHCPAYAADKPIAAAADVTDAFVRVTGPHPRRLCSLSETIRIVFRHYAPPSHQCRDTVRDALCIGPVAFANDDSRARQDCLARKRLLQKLMIKPPSVDSPYGK